MFESCRSRKMLKDAYLDAKIGFDTEENEPLKDWGVIGAARDLAGPAETRPGVKDARLGDRPNHSNLWAIRIRSNFCQNLSTFARIHQNSRN